MGSSKNPCLIPARIGSTRFPSKPLAIIAGKPMIVRVAQIVEKVFGLDATFVVTDSDEIAAVAGAAGIQSIMVRDDVATGTDRVALAAQLLPPSDRYFNVQGDEPILDVDDLRAFKIFSEENGAEVTNAYYEGGTPTRAQSSSAIKVVTNREGRLMFASRSPIPWCNLTASPSYALQVCMYSFTSYALDAFLSFGRGPIEVAENIEILRFLENGFDVRMFSTSVDSHPVDHPADVKVVEDLILSRERTA